MNYKPVQVISLALIILLLVNLILLATKQISTLFFWIILVICAIGAYFITHIRKV